MNLRQELHYQYRCARLGLGFLTGRFIHCNLQVTYRCNFKCQICDFWKTQHDPAEELSLDDIRADRPEAQPARHADHLPGRRRAADPRGHLRHHHGAERRQPFSDPHHQRLVRRRDGRPRHPPGRTAGDLRLGRLPRSGAARRPARLPGGVGAGRPGAGTVPQEPARPPQPRPHDQRADGRQPRRRRAAHPACAARSGVTYMVNLYSWNRGTKTAAAARQLGDASTCWA